MQAVFFEKPKLQDILDQKKAYYWHDVELNEKYDVVSDYEKEVIEGNLKISKHFLLLKKNDELIEVPIDKFVHIV